MTPVIRDYIIGKLWVLKYTMKEKHIKATTVWSDLTNMHLNVTDEMIKWWINNIDEDGMSKRDLNEIMLVANKVWRAVNKERK